MTEVAGSTATIKSAHITNRHMTLAALDTTQKINDMIIPGHNTHLLKEKLKELFPVTVNVNGELHSNFNIETYTSLTMRIISNEHA